MRCKPGDLAVIVRSDDGNEGRILEVVRASDRRDDGEFWWICKAMQPIIGMNRRIAAGELMFAADCALRPLRDADGEDEMLRIAGKPRELHEA